MIRRVIWILFLFPFVFLGVGVCVFAQTPDTICYKPKKWKLKPSTDFDQRFSFIRGAHVNIWGQKLGLLINEKFKIGIGGYFLHDRLKSIKVYNDGTPYYYLKRNLTFGTIYFEPFLIRRKYWEISIPFELGIGRSYGKTYDNLTNTFLGSTTAFFFPTGTGLSLSLKPPAFFEFKPFRWIGINFLAGYRYNLLESIFKTDYDGPFWSISGAVFLDKILDDYRRMKAKKREKKNAE